MNEWHELKRTRKTIAFGIKNCSYKVGTHIYKWLHTLKKKHARINTS